MAGFHERTNMTPKELWFLDIWDDDGEESEFGFATLGECYEVILTRNGNGQFEITPADSSVEWGDRGHYAGWDIFDFYAGNYYVRTPQKVAEVVRRGNDAWARAQFETAE